MRCLQVLLFSGTSRLYLRHVVSAYGSWADGTAVLLNGLLLPLLFGPGMPLQGAISDTVHAALSVGVLAVLLAVRGLLLPVTLTAEGMQEVLVQSLGGAANTTTQSSIVAASLRRTSSMVTGSRTTSTTGERTRSSEAAGGRGWQAGVG